MIVVGQGALARPDGARVLGAARRIAESCGLVSAKIGTGSNVLHHAAARTGGLDLGFVPGPGGRDVESILAGCRSGDIENPVPFSASTRSTPAIWEPAFVIYQGHHGGPRRPARRCHPPGAAYTEKDGTYVNTEGRVQLARRAVFPTGEAREDWKILRALSGGRQPAASVRVTLREAATPHVGKRTRYSPRRIGSRARLGGPSGSWGRSPRTHSCIRSRISTEPTRSAAPARRWPNAPSCLLARRATKRRRGAVRNG